LLSRRRYIRYVLIVSGLVQFTRDPVSAADRTRHVVVISLDGFPAYALHDSDLPLPVLRRLIREGGAAQSMKTVNPTITWPNHTAMVTGVSPGENGVLYNGLPVRGGEGKPVRLEENPTKKELVQVRTLYDLAHDEGLTTAEVAWVAIRDASSIDWSLPESSPAGSQLQEEMAREGLLSLEDLKAIQRDLALPNDELRVRAAAYLIERHRPNLLLLHLAATDDVQHTYGARTLAAQTALVLADRQIQRILEAVDRAGIRDSTTVLVVSDHGFKSYRHIISPNVLLRQNGLIRAAGGEPECDAFALTEGGTAYVYITNEAKRASTLPALTEQFRRLTGIDKVITAEEFNTYDFPHMAGQSRMADLVLVAAPGYAFQDRISVHEPVMELPESVEKGTHGYLNSDPDMDAILVAWGAGIRRGSHTGTVPNVDVAATIAYLLKLKFDRAIPVFDLLSR
jgi:predicted AlkP superfamily pyrophosphatase or phosphodiesterase